MFHFQLYSEEFHVGIMVWDFSYFFFPTIELDTCILTANEKNSTLRTQFLIKTAEKQTAVED